MAVTTPTTHLAMTDQQQREFDERGFVVVEDFFDQAELA